ncbi:HAD-IA family hydrolase [Leifsonia sp. F6_8S_P_1B]|uniref:HAD-IA family hydrolase n=2 Tax=Leifsonia williamsii TaxID=3035919 RepID=A0ABT8K911_9MICO|nr:HAD-IA family hydrolase [Leifsonia williamsii]MDN4613946.1 HAD-IA family hydrolase [Leifsonia williamsii]
MDGTLVDSTPVVEAVWTAFGERHGVDAADILAYSHGRQAMDTIVRFLPDASAEERLAIAQGLVAEELTRTDGIVQIGGAVALLEELEALGAPVAVVTSAPRELAVARLEAAGLRVPDVLVSAEDVERGKPDPQGYLLAAERLGVAIGDCVIFEDAEAGVAAAVASGARVFVVGDLATAGTEGLERLPDYVGVRAALR